MPGSVGDLTVLCQRITSTEQHIRWQRERITRFPSDSAEARYARTVLHVLRRSLMLMLAERIRLERELQQWLEPKQRAMPRKMRLLASEGDSVKTALSDVVQSASNCIYGG